MTRFTLFFVVLLSGEGLAADVKPLRDSVTFYASFDDEIRADFGKGQRTLDTRYNHATEKNQFTIEKGYNGPAFRIAKGKGVSGGAFEAVDVLPRNGRVFFPAKGNIAFKPDGWSGSLSLWCKTDPDKLLKTRFCDPVQIAEKGANNGGLWFDFNDAKPRDLRHGAFPAVAPGTKGIGEDDPKAPMVRVPGVGWKADDWHHVVLTFENLDTGKGNARTALHIDGKLIGEVKDRAIAMGWDIEKAGIYFSINYIGLLDEFALFDRVLTLDEVKTLHAKPDHLSGLKAEKNEPVLTSLLPSPFVAKFPLSQWDWAECSVRASAETPPTIRELGDRAIHARALLKKYCAGCHTGQGGQPFDVLDHSMLTGKHPVPFVDGKGGRSQIMEFLEDGSMPPAGKDRPRDDEIKVIKAWIEEGAREFPKSFDDAYVLDTVHADWTSRKPADNFRYVSLAHLVQDSSTGLREQESRLRAALVAATPMTVSLEPVDRTGTVFRLDIAKAGWISQEVFKLARVDDVQPLRPFDLLLLESPFQQAEPKVQSLLSKSRFVPPVPYLRGDWLAEVLAPGSPLGDDLRSLVELQKPGKDGDLKCGPKPRPFASPKKPAGPAPITAWYGTHGAEPFKVEFVINGSANPVVGPSETLDISVKSGANASFKLFRVLAEGFTSMQRVDGGEVLNADMARPLTIGKGIKSPDLKAGQDSVTEYFVLVAWLRNEPPPVPVILRSTHDDACPEGRAPVWRIVFERDEKFDPSKAVRKVVAVHVRKKP